MSDFEDVERLIRLKRHEQPPEDFVEDFMRSFHQRQRVELMNQSARGLVLERLKGVFEGLLSPKYALAGAAALMMVGAGAYTLLPTKVNGPQVVQGTEDGPSQVISYDEFKMARAQMTQDPLYLGSHYKGGFGDVQEWQAAQKLPSSKRGNSVQGTALPASYTQPSGFGFKLDLE